MSRKLIVGLGNPGTKYEGTRHNIGFEALEVFARRYQLDVSTSKFHGLYATGRVGGQDVVLLMPQTYMNKSGKSVEAARNFYNIDLSDVIVLHDELDLDLGVLRIKSGGGHGGHNGLRDIIQMTGGKEFVRLRLGIGRPAHGNVTGHVLGKYTTEERMDVDELLETACDALEVVMSEGVAPAQNRFH